MPATAYIKLSKAHILVYLFNMAYDKLCLGIYYFVITYSNSQPHFTNIFFPYIHLSIKNIYSN